MRVAFTGWSAVHAISLAPLADRWRPRADVGDFRLFRRVIASPSSRRPVHFYEAAGLTRRRWPSWRALCAETTFPFCFPFVRRAWRIGQRAQRRPLGFRPAHGSRRGPAVRCPASQAGPRSRRAPSPPIAATRPRRRPLPALELPAHATPHAASRFGASGRAGRSSSPDDPLIESRRRAGLAGPQGTSARRNPSPPRPE